MSPPCLASGWVPTRPWEWRGHRSDPTPGLAYPSPPRQGFPTLGGREGFQADFTNKETEVYCCTAKKSKDRAGGT